MFRTGLFREPAYWISMAICYAFMIPVDGWLTKHSAPIVLYRPRGHQRHLSHLGHPAGGVRLRLRLAHGGDAHVGRRRRTRERGHAGRAGRAHDAVVLLVLGAFDGDGGVSYAAHRWVMHGSGMGWHRSHHAPPAARLERNDLFPVCFSAVGVLLLRSAPWGSKRFGGSALGVTAYGAAYLFVHEVYIHQRLRVPVPAPALPRVAADVAPRHHQSGRRALRDAPTAGPERRWPAASGHAIVLDRRVHTLPLTSTVPAHHHGSVTGRWSMSRPASTALRQVGTVGPVVKTS